MRGPISLYDSASDSHRSTVRLMWRIVCVLALASAACGGDDDGQTFEDWVADVPDVSEEQVPCVVKGLRSEHDAATLSEWTELDVASWSEQDYLDNAEVSGALADAIFACET